MLTLRGRSGSRESRRWAWRVALAGVFILVASIIVLTFLSKRIYVAYVGVFGFLFGLSLLTGVILVLADPLLRRLLGGMGKLPGRIAAGNIIQNLGRTGVAVAAFMVALSLSIGLGSMIGSFRQSLIWWMGSQLRGDMYISNASDMEVPEDFYEEIRSIPGIGGVDTYRKVPVLYRGRTVHVAGIKADVLQRFARFGWVAGGDEHWEAVKKGDVIVSESFARSFGAGPGSEITLEGVAGPVRLRIEGVFYDYSTEHGLIMMDRGTYIGLYGDRTINSIAVFIDPAEPRRKQILDDVRGRALSRGLPAFTREQFHSNILEVFDSTFAVTRSMRVIAIVIAFFGITGALMTLFIERQRDFGILRALGFSTGQVAGMTLLEAIGMGLVELRAQRRRGDAACHPADPRHQFAELQLDDFLLPRLAALRHHGGNGAGRQRRSGALPDLEGDADVPADADPRGVGFGNQGKEPQQGRRRDRDEGRYRQSGVGGRWASGLRASEKSPSSLKRDERGRSRGPEPNPEAPASERKESRPSKYAIMRAIVSIVMLAMLVCRACLRRRRLAAGHRPAHLELSPGPRGTPGVPHRVVVFHGKSARWGGKPIRLPAHVLPSRGEAETVGPGQPLVAARPLPGSLCRH